MVRKVVSRKIKMCERALYEHQYHSKRWLVTKRCIPTVDATNRFIYLFLSSKTSNLCGIGRFWYSTKSFQIDINIKPKEMLWKVTLNLKQPHTWKTINFIRCREICRVWDVSLPPHPFRRLRVFCHLMRLYFAKRATTMSPRIKV